MTALSSPRTSMSLSLYHDEVPYSPHHLPSSPRPVKFKSGTLRRTTPALQFPTASKPSSLLSASTASNTSRWPTRRSSLLPPTPAGDSDTLRETALEASPGLSSGTEEGEPGKIEGGHDWYEQSRPKGKMTGLQRNHRIDASEAPEWTGFGHASSDW
jgi:hypothetical protein